MLSGHHHPYFAWVCASISVCHGELLQKRWSAIIVALRKHTVKEIPHQCCHDTLSPYESLIHHAAKLYIYEYQVISAVTPQQILPWTGSFASHVPTSRLPSPWLQLPALGKTLAWQHLVSTTCFAGSHDCYSSPSLWTPRVVGCASSEQPVDLVLTLLHPAWIGVGRLLPALTIVPAPRRRHHGSIQLETNNCEWTLNLKVFTNFGHLVLFTTTTVHISQSLSLSLPSHITWFWNSLQYHATSHHTHTSGHMDASSETRFFVR